MDENGVYARIVSQLQSRDRKLAWSSRESDVSYNKLRNLGRRPEAVLNAQDLFKVADALKVSPRWLANGGAISGDAVYLRDLAIEEIERMPSEMLRVWLSGLRAR